MKSSPKKRSFWWHLYIPMVVLTGFLISPPILRQFAQTGLRGLYILVASGSVTFCLTPVCIWIARRYNILDNPDARKTHGVATPLLGGAAVFIAFSAAIFLNGIGNAPVFAILAASLLIFIVGLVDDIREVSAKIKLMAQVVAVIIVIQQGIILRVLPQQLGLTAQLANTALTFLWIVGITNAMNFFDGMNGLAAGLGAMISFFLGIVAFQTSQPFIGWISMAIMGSCLGFLPYNLRDEGKASVFLGDAGSTVIGFILACIAVYSDWSIHNPVVSLVSPLLIFWVIIFDMIHITVDRILTGKVTTVKQWLEYVGHDHLHHRLAQVIGSHRKSVVFIFILNGCLGISAIILRDVGPLEAALLILQAALLVLLITVLERHGRFPGKTGKGR